MSTEAPVYLQSRIRMSLLGLAVCDALGAPLEFRQRRKDRNYIKIMMPNQNFNLPPGHFTDDTSMALCLAKSLLENQNKTNSKDQVQKYADWLFEGYMSSLPGRAFDVGNQTRAVLSLWREMNAQGATSGSFQSLITEKFASDRSCGNGSLMRVLPCALLATSIDEAERLGKESSFITHPHKRCVDICAIYCKLVYLALAGTTKIGLIDCLQQCIGKANIDFSLRERLQPYISMSIFKEKPRWDINSSGYVLDSLEAALWAFFKFDSFEEGAIEVVNLGDDADTVGAIYGGLAGAHYGFEDCIPNEWIQEMKQLQLVENIVDKVCKWRCSILVDS